MNEFLLEYVNGNYWLVEALVPQPPVIKYVNGTVVFVKTINGITKVEF